MLFRSNITTIPKQFQSFSRIFKVRMRQSYTGERTIIAAQSRAAMNPRAQAILNYWFGEGWTDAGASYFPSEKSKMWFQGGPEVDQEIKEKFGLDCEVLAGGSYDDWKDDVFNCLGGIILADQMTRNVYRGSSKMFQSDEKGLCWAKSMIRTGQHNLLRPLERIWVYMPLMHSERLQDQEECVALFKSLARDCSQLENGEMLEKMALENVKYSELHRDVVLHWGRFPHRNLLLGRKSTPEEAAGLANGSIPKF